MKRLGILHISDLHFGYEAALSARNKAPISEKLKGELGQSDPKEIFLNRVKALLGRDRNVDVLAFTGDAGLSSDPDTMKLGITYLSKLKSLLNVTPSHVIIAPGNHDLNRMSPENEELSQLTHLCSSEGFTLPTRETPACVMIQEIPIIAINTCLGAKEYAFYELPGDLLKMMRDSVKTFSDLGDKIDFEMPEEIKYQLKAMDIPAIGQAQLNGIDEYLQNSSGNSAILLGHHNPLPTHTLVIRPYAEIIDVGRLIFNLIGSERRILFLHGHTHCDIAFIARAPEELESGFIACLGGNGLHEISSGAVASASYIQVLTDDKSNFLAATVSRFQQKGVNFSMVRTFPIWDDAIRLGTGSISIDELPARTSLSIEEVAERLKVKELDKLAVELLRRRSYRQIEIDEVDRPFDDWRITRNI